MLLLGVVVVAEWQLQQIIRLASNAAPISERMKDMQDFVVATTELDGCAERFLIIRSRNEQNALAVAVENFMKQFHNFERNVEGNLVQLPSASELSTKVQVLTPFLDKLITRSLSSFRSRELNETMKRIYQLIEEIKISQQRWASEALTVLKEKNAAQNAIVAEMNKQFLLLVGGALGLLITTAVFITRSIDRPVRTLIQTARQIAGGKLDARASVNTRDEIGQLAVIFNRMTDQLRELIVCLERQMSDIKKSSEALKLSEDNLRITLKSIADAVIATDNNGEIVRMNPTAETLTGWTEAEAKGRMLLDVFRMYDKSNGLLVEDLVERSLGSHEKRASTEHSILRDKGGKEYRIADSIAPIRSTKDEVVGLVIVFRDITDEYAMQTQLQQSRKMDAIGQLAGGVAHDFNNMLCGIIGSTELAQLKLQANQDPAEYLALILDSAKRAAALTDKLLSFARKQPSASASIDVNKPLQDAMSLLGSTVDKRIRIHSLLPEKGMWIIGDPAQLQSAFLNILINSTHAMPEGGEIFVSSSTIALDENYCANSTFDIKPGLYVEIEIRDTGVGISEENVERIFEPFFTTKEAGKGTGLGLPAVLGTVQQHNGEIIVYSKIDIGTSFHILLPLADDNNSDEKPLLVMPITGSGTILIVDDERVMRMTAGAILEELGYNVLFAENGMEGVELFKEKIEQIDLVIIDMIMPKMNGRDCFLKIKEIKQDVRVILSSGFSREEELQPMMDAGLTGFIRKPFRSVELAQIVHTVLSG